MKPQRIVVTSDLLRVTGSKASRAGFRTNTEFFAALFSSQLKAATRLPVSILEWDDNGTFDGQAVYSALGFPADAHGWARIHTAEATPAAVALFAPHVENALVIGFEITPFLQAVLNALGVPFVDARWHPLRFLDDIFFGFSTNRPAVFETIMAYGLTADEVQVHVGLHRAAAIRRKGFRQEKPFRGTLLIGQTPFDSSLIHNGRISRFDMYEDAIETLSANGPLGFRPHPFSPEPTPALSDMIFRHAITVLDSKSDIYQLLAAGDIERVVSLSSGTLVEAGYFGVPATRLIPERQHYLPGAGGPDNDPAPGHLVYAGVTHAFLSVDFWADILAPVLDETFRNDRPLPFRPDRLRQVNGSYWGYLGSGGTNVIMPYNTPE